MLSTQVIILNYLSCIIIFLAKGQTWTDLVEQMYLVQVHIHVFVMDFTEMQNYDNFSPC